MNIFTIGFTEKNAENFFDLIKNSGIKKVVDVRLNNISQLAGYAKKNDLEFFLREICSVEYIHLPELAPTKQILTPYRNGDVTWATYEDNFLNLMAKRNIEKLVKPEILDNSCLLCSEHLPHLCHRRLVIDYLNKNTNLNLKVQHLF